MSRRVPNVPPLLIDTTVALVGPVPTKTIVNAARIGTPVLGRSQWLPMGDACNWLLGGGTMQLAAWGPLNDAIEASDTYEFHAYCWPRAQSLVRLWQFTVRNSNGAVGAFQTADKPGGKAFAVTSNTLQTLRFVEILTSVDDTGEAISNAIVLAPFSDSLNVLAASVCELPMAVVGEPGDGEKGVEVDSLSKGRLIYEADESISSSEEQLSVDGVIGTAAALCGNGQTPIRRAKLFDWHYATGVLETGSSYTNIFRTTLLAQTRQVRAEATRSVNYAVLANLSGGASTGNFRVSSSVNASTSVVAVTATTPTWHTGTITVETDDLEGTAWARDRETLTFEHRAVTSPIRTYAISVGE